MPHTRHSCHRQRGLDTRTHTLHDRRHHSNRSHLLHIRYRIDIPAPWCKCYSSRTGTGDRWSSICRFPGRRPANIAVPRCNRGWCCTKDCKCRGSRCFPGHIGHPAGSIATEHIPVWRLRYCPLHRSRLQCGFVQSTEPELRRHWAGSRDQYTWSPNRPFRRSSHHYPSTQCACTRRRDLHENLEGKCKLLDDAEPDSWHLIRRHFLVHKDYGIGNSGSWLRQDNPHHSNTHLDPDNRLARDLQSIPRGTDKYSFLEDYCRTRCCGMAVTGTR